MKNIYLVGMMGAGKSVTGRRLASLLGRRFVESDQLIVEKVGKSIAQIFDESGESEFRKIESGIVREISQSQNAVISLGGGVVTQAENLTLMKKTGIIVYLRAKPETLWNRVRHNKNRPLLSVADPLKRIQGLLSDRAAQYEKSDVTVDTDEKNPEAVAEEIRSLLEAYSGKN